MYNKTIKSLENKHQVFQPDKVHLPINRLASEPLFLYLYYWSPEKQCQLEVGSIISKRNVTPCSSPTHSSQIDADIVLRTWFFKIFMQKRSLQVLNFTMRANKADYTAKTSPLLPYQNPHDWLTILLGPISKTTTYPYPIHRPCRSQIS